MERFRRGRLPLVNPDIIALSLPSSAGARRELQAGRIAIEQRRQLLATRAAFVIETTLTGAGERQLMLSAIDAGYRVGLVYVGLDDLELSMFRVRVRVATGGHDVPISDLKRRFERSLANLDLVAPLAQRLLLFDNSGRRRRLLLSRQDSHVRFCSSDWPEWATRSPVLAGLGKGA
ncbi:zeta toxin family protein [Sandaracinobacteroides saxicola]|uniref:zeta toxin family protein n=1 Tax=Sandaracinobacteroides saxicola TaxID=2759707 RepID=UPI001FB151CC|nr:zeta toxin family protein [Sandaracinobacteroides saxicola]